jgi:hypothetical protein
MSEGAQLAAAAGTGTDHDQELAALRYGWGEAYEIERDAAGGFQAKRRDGLGGPITADDPDALWQGIKDDYDLKPVPRDLPPEALP